MKYVTLVSSEAVPSKYLDRFAALTEILNEKNYSIRTSGNFKLTSLLREKAKNFDFWLKDLLFYNKNNTEIKLAKYNEARALAAKHHRAWGYLDARERKRKAKIVYLLFGRNLETYSDLLVVYTGSGMNQVNSSFVGLTDQLITIARANNIEVYNVKNDFTYAALLEKLDNEA